MAEKGYGDIQNQGHQGLETHAGTLDARKVVPAPVKQAGIGNQEDIQPKNISNEIGSGLPKIPTRAVSLKK